MLEERVSERLDLLNKAYKAADYESLATMYTDDSKIITADYGVFDGPEAAVAFSQAGREKIGIMSFTYDVIAVAQLDDLITGFVKVTYYGANDVSMSTAFCMTTFKEVDGELKIFRDTA